MEPTLWRLLSSESLSFYFLRIRRPPRSTLSSSSAASDVYKRQPINDSDDSDHWDHSNDNATHEVPLESSTDLDNSDNLYGCDHSDDCDHCDHSNDNATPICSVTNAAFATGTFGNNTITSNTANATVTIIQCPESVSYTHLRAHETPEHLVC